MSYPNDLKEYQQLEGETYPFRLFFNESKNVKQGQNIMYLHWHEEFEIIIMQEGSAIFHVDSKPYELQAGEVLFVPSGGLHVGYSLLDAPIRFVSVVFHSSLFKDWKQDPEHIQFVAPYIEKRYQFPVKPAAHDANCSSHYTLLDTIIDEVLKKGPAFQLVVKNQLHLLIVFLSRIFLPEQVSGRTNERHSFNRERFKPLLAYMESHFDEKMTIESAARSVNLNPYHFCKTFKKLTGRTFIDYVNLCRVNEAERLLLETDLTVTEIAGRVGCDNPNYFTKLYKTYKGVTPSGVRK